MTTFRRSLPALVCLSSSLALAWDGHPIIAIALGMFGCAELSARVIAIYDRRAREGDIPRWVADMELIREYLADEDAPEVRQRQRSEHGG